MNYSKIELESANALAKMYGLIVAYDINGIITLVPPEALDHD